MADRHAWLRWTRPTAPKLKRGWWSLPSADTRLHWGLAGPVRCQWTLSNGGGRSPRQPRPLAAHLSKDNLAGEWIQLSCTRLEIYFSNCSCSKQKKVPHISMCASYQHLNVFEWRPRCFPHADFWGWDGMLNWKIGEGKSMVTLLVRWFLKWLIRLQQLAKEKCCSRGGLTKQFSHFQGSRLAFVTLTRWPGGKGLV